MDSIGGRPVRMTETLEKITVYYTGTNNKGEIKDRRKKFDLRSAAERFVERTPGVYRVDIEATALTWLVPADAAAPLGEPEPAIA